MTSASHALAPDLDGQAEGEFHVSLSTAAGSIYTRITAAIQSTSYSRLSASPFPTSIPPEHLDRLQTLVRNDTLNRNVTPVQIHLCGSACVFGCSQCSSDFSAKAQCAPSPLLHDQRE